MGGKQLLACLLAIVAVTAPVAATSAGTGGLTAAPTDNYTTSEGAGTPGGGAEQPSSDDGLIRVKIEPANDRAAARARQAVNVRHDFGDVVTADVTPQKLEALRRAPGIEVSRVARVYIGHHKKGHSRGGDDGGSSNIVSVNWLQPTDGTEVSGAVGLTIDATTTKSNIDYVQWQVDGGTWHRASYSGGNWYANWDTATVGDGSHTLTARAVNKRGDSNTSSIQVSVDNVNAQPTVNWVEPSDGTTVSGDVRVRLAAADSDDAIQSVTWSVDGGADHQATYNKTSGYYEAVWNSSNHQDDTHQLTATVTDERGATSTAGITVATDNVNAGPTVSWQSPANGSVLEGPVRLQIDASDVDGTVTNVTWAVNNDYTSRQVTYNASSGYYEATWNTTEVQDGSHFLAAQATDDEGKTDTAFIEVSVDNVDYAPNGYWRVPEEGQRVNDTVTVEIAGEDDEGVANVTWRVDDGSWQQARKSSAGYWVAGWNTTQFAEGSHSLTAIVEDTTGQTDRATVNVTVDNEGPTVSWVEPVDGQTASETQPIRLAADAPGSIQSVEWRVNNGSYRTATYNQTTGYWHATWETGNLTTGIYRLTARATADSGEVANATISVNVDNEPRVSDQTPYGIEMIYNNDSIQQTAGGDGVDVAVLDTGVDTDHPDLVNQIETCRDYTGKGTCEDGNGHGTHVSGTILANAGSDGDGVYGVAPGADLHTYKVLDDSGYGYWDDVAAAIDDAAKNDVEVISMSLGGSNQSSLVASEIKEHKDEMVIITSAGNSGPNLDTMGYPGANNGTIGVAAVDSNLQVTDFSSRGLNATSFCECDRYVEVAAPGYRTLSTWNDGGYNKISGTSMAAPHVSGFAAKVWASGQADLNGDGTVTPAEVREYIRQRTIDVTDGQHARAGYDPAAGLGMPQLAS